MKNIKTKNFNITITKKDEVIVSTVTKDWKVTWSPISTYGQALKFYMDQISNEELNELLTEIYYVCNSMLTNMELTKHIRDFFDEKIKEAEIVEEISEEEDKKNLKVVKDVEEIRGKTTGNN